MVYIYSIITLTVVANPVSGDSVSIIRKRAGKKRIAEPEGLAGNYIHRLQLHIQPFFNLPAKHGGVQFLLLNKYLHLYLLQPGFVSDYRFLYGCFYPFPQFIAAGKVIKIAIPNAASKFFILLYFAKSGGHNQVYMLRNGIADAAFFMRIAPHQNIGAQGPGIVLVAHITEKNACLYANRRRFGPVK
jgi:hypothetical protein